MVCYFAHFEQSLKGMKSLCNGNSLLHTSSMASGQQGDSWTNKPAMRDDRVSPLSHH